MRRETRLNLWFLAIFLVLSLPGAVILFHKKLDPSASRMDQPDAVLNQVPYMTPPPVPPGVRWMLPPATDAWLAELTRQRAGTPMLSAVPPGPEWEPVISPDHVLQVMSMSPAGPSTRVGLLVWHGDWPDSVKDYQLGAQLGGTRSAGTVEAVDSIAIPPEVRKELVSLGYAHPPKQVRWLRASLPRKISPADRVTLTLANVMNPSQETSVSWTVQ